MYDPHSVAFDIKSPWFWLGRHRSSWFTIWHHDPEISGRGNRTDDSCGWFRPPTTKAEREGISKLGEREWSTIFNARDALQRGADYAYVCFEPTTYDAIYWTWRAIKFTGRNGWMFGDRRNALSAAELQEIYQLSANPVDNFRVTVAGIKSAEDCAEFFLMVYSAYKRFNRPWYRHPRWHIHHWYIQWHWLQAFNRWAFARCSKCDGRFRWGESVVGSWGGDQIWHGDCSGQGAANSPAQGSAK